jgi:fibronectin type 3 domain-containing protein
MKDKPLLVLIAGVLGCAWIFLWSGCSGKGDIPPASVIQGGKVSISWDEVPGALSYNVYYANSAGLTKWNCVKIPKAARPLTLTDLSWDRSYFFGLSAVTAAGEGDILGEREYTVNKAEGSVHLSVPEVPTPEPKPPQKPAPQSSLNAGDGKATLGWDGVPGATAYNLYISESPGVNRQNGRKIANVSNPHTLTGLTAGAVYYGVVTAMSQTGESAESSELSFTAE